MLSVCWPWCDVILKYLDGLTGWLDRYHVITGAGRQRSVDDFNGRVDSFHLSRPTYWGHVRYVGVRRSSASPRPPCDVTPSASAWPSPRQTPGPPCPYPSDKTSPDAIINDNVESLPTWETETWQLTLNIYALKFNKRFSDLACWTYEVSIRIAILVHGMFVR